MYEKNGKRQRWIKSIAQAVAAVSGTANKFEIWTEESGGAEKWSEKGIYRPIEMPVSFSIVYIIIIL